MNSRVSIQEGWHRAGSLEGFAFCDCQYLRYVVEVACPASTEIDSLSPKVTSFLRRRRHMFKPFPERQVDELLELHTAPLIEPFEGGSDIIIEGYRSSHASRHNIFDALMQTDRAGC
jgi:hypothetical protein